MGKASFLVYFMHVFRVLLTNISASKILLVIITWFQMYVHTPWLVLGTKNEEEEEFCVVKNVRRKHHFLTKLMSTIAVFLNILVMFNSNTTILLTSFRPKYEGGNFSTVLDL